MIYIIWQQFNLYETEHESVDHLSIQIHHTSSGGIL